MRIQATPLTSGSITPDLQTISGGYRYQKDPDWYPGHPAYREDTPVRKEWPMSEKRAKRVREFAGLLDEGWTPAEAGELMGLARRTAQVYERDSRALRKEAAS